MKPNRTFLYFPSFPVSPITQYHRLNLVEKKRKKHVGVAQYFVEYSKERCSGMKLEMMVVRETKRELARAFIKLLLLL